MAINLDSIKLCPQEIFVGIKGYEGKYLISNFGRVASLLTTRGRIRNTPLILKTFISGKNKSGYDEVRLGKNTKNKTIHRLVAEAFLPNPLNLPEINHKDEDKRNNCVENLEWCDRKYNANYGTTLERTRRSRKIKITFMDTGAVEVLPSELDVYKAHGFVQRLVRECCKGMREEAYGCRFEFAGR